jgi:pimeloyl-ACP methyl ester carboxylesterase
VGIDSGRHEGAKGIAMTRTRQILFIQGGGAGAHDQWDDKLVESLRRELGGGYEVRYPRMPDEGDPGYARWSAAIRREMADLDNGAVVAGHSVGAAILVNAVAEQPPERRLGAIVLIAAPFVGEGGWPSDEFELTSDLGARLPPGVRVHVFHGLQDETAPPSHAGLYALAIPQAQVRQLPGRDHQLNNNMSEVAEAVRILAVTRMWNAYAEVLPGRGEAAAGVLDRGLAQAGRVRAQAVFREPFAGLFVLVECLGLVTVFDGAVSLAAGGHQPRR